MEFYAVDLETANCDYSSICQIGIAHFIDDNPEKVWRSYVNPEMYFDPRNIAIHGITPEKVKDAHPFYQLYNSLNEILSGNIVVHHGAFDRIAFNRACEKYELPPIDAIWLDTTRIVRRTWEQFAYRGYGLFNVATFLCYEFDHHDALEDALMAGRIAYCCCVKKGVDITDWVQLVHKRIPFAADQEAPPEINREGEYYGLKIVFTGSLSISRHAAERKAADLGFEPQKNVTKETNVLVVGIQDVDKINGFEKSSKHRKAEKLIEEGQEITIMSDLDFMKLIEI